MTIEELKEEIKEFKQSLFWHNLVHLLFTVGVLIALAHEIGGCKDHLNNIYKQIDTLKEKK